MQSYGIIISENACVAAAVAWLYVLSERLGGENAFVRSTRTSEGDNLGFFSAHSAKMGVAKGVSAGPNSVIW